MKDFWEKFGLLATALGFIVDTITVFLLAVSAGNGQSNLSSIVSSTPTILAIGLIGFLTYLGFVREYWLRELRQKRTEWSSFGEFFIKEVVVFSRPFLLLPIGLLIGFLIIALQPQIGWERLGWLGCVVGLVLFGIIVTAEQEINKRLATKFLSTDNELFISLMNIVRSHVEKNGFAISYDLAGHEEGMNTLFNTAMRLWYIFHGDNENLVYHTYRIYVLEKSVLPIEVGVLAKSHLNVTEPWIAEIKRFKKIMH